MSVLKPTVPCSGLRGVLQCFNGFGLKVLFVKPRLGPGAKPPHEIYVKLKPTAPIPNQRWGSQRDKYAQSKHTQVPARAYSAQGSMVAIPPWTSIGYSLVEDEIDARED